MALDQTAHLTFEVTVCNKRTGEQETLSVMAEGPEDAQREALVQLFRQRGWRAAMAYRPDQHL